MNSAQLQRNWIPQPFNSFSSNLIPNCSPHYRTHWTIRIPSYPSIIHLQNNNISLQCVLSTQERMHCCIVPHVTANVFVWNATWTGSIRLMRLEMFWNFIRWSNRPKLISCRAALKHSRTPSLMSSASSRRESRINWSYCRLWSSRSSHSLINYICVWRRRRTSCWSRRTW